MLKYCEDLAIKLSEIRAIQSNDNSQEACFSWFSLMLVSQQCHAFDISSFTINSHHFRTLELGSTVLHVDALLLNCYLRTTITIKVALSFKALLLIRSIFRERKVPHVQYFMLSFSSCIIFIITNSHTVQNLPLSLQRPTLWLKLKTRQS